MMSYSRPILCSFLLVVAFAALTGAHAEGTDDNDEPIPIRRVLLRAEQVAAEMERARVGVLKQLPLENFEGLVRRAARASAALRKNPRLVEAKYHAHLEGEDLIGWAEWKVHNPGPSSRLFSLDPFNLALRRMPRYENHEAFTADFDGRKPAVLLEQAGLQSVFLDWSVHGATGLDGLRFDLNLPPAALATLDLDLPPDQAVAHAPDHYTVTGPLPADTADRRQWRVGFKGNGPLRLRLRPLKPSAQSPPLLTAQLEAKQQLTPDGLEAEYAFKLEAVSQEVREVECECDPVLRPVEVVAPDLERWEVLPATASRSPVRLHVWFRDPVRIATVKVYCLAPLGVETSGTWTSPAVRLLGAVQRGEELVLRVHPDVRFEDWRSGGFRLMKAITEGDGTRVLTLVGGGFGSLAASPNGVRPQAQVATASVEFQARQLAWWQVRKQQSVLTCQLSCEAVRGRVFQLPLELPAGWRVERVEVSPSGLLRGWDVVQERGVAVLLVNLERPLTPRGESRESATASEPRTVRLSVRLSANGPALEWAFPDVAPQGVRLREGALAITFDEQVYSARAESTAQLAEPAQDGPWGSQKPDYYYPYHGEPVRGTLRLEPREPRVGVHCAADVVLASGRAAVVTHVQLQPLVGSPETIELLVSAPTGHWEWKTVQGANHVRAFEPLLKRDIEQLAVLGGCTALDKAVVAQATFRPSTEPRWWRLTLARPLREPVSLDAACEIAPASADRWDVPLLATPSGNDSDNEVKLFLVGANLMQIETEGLQEAGSAEQAGSGQLGAPWRAFRYRSLPAKLRLHGRTLPADPAGAIVVDRARLTTYVERTGRLLHHYRFQVWNWRQRAFPLRLPAGAVLLAARVDGRWIGQTPAGTPVGDEMLIELPAFAAGRQQLPATASTTNGWHSYELVYSVNSEPWRLWAEVPTPSTILPVHPIAFRHTWRLPPGVVPLHEDHYRCLPSAICDFSGEEGGLPFLLASAWSATRHWSLSSDWEAEQRQRVQEIAAALNKTLEGRPVALSTFFERLASQASRSEPFVLDTQALHQAGLSLDSMPSATADAGAPPWEAFELVYVPCQAAPLLTTRREMEVWRSAARLARRGESEAVPKPSASIEAAVAEAAARGHDNSGRFRLAAEWLHAQQDSAYRGARATSDSLAAILGFLHAEDWTEWEPTAGVEEGGCLVVVRQDVFPSVAALVTVLLCLGCWRLPARARVGLLLGWLAAAGLGYLWLPASMRVLGWLPILGASGVVLIWYIAWAVRRVKQRAVGQPSPPASPLVTASVLMAAVGFGLGRAVLVSAGPPAEWTVFLVRDTTRDKISVLAPPDLVDQLEAQARRTDVPDAGAVLVSAEYEAKPVDDAIEFKADFQVYCLGGGATVLHLPLEAVRLDGETLLDGARVYPAVARPPQVGYTLRIEKGDSPLHRVSMRFRAAVNNTSDEREVQCSLPSVPCSRLTLDLPNTAREPEALTGTVPLRGRQHVTARPTGPRLEADLGRFTTPLRLRWVGQSATPRPAQVQVRESYLWDLRPDVATLTALLRYAVNQGVVRTVALDLPENLEVLAVRLAASAAPAGPRLKTWSVAGTGSTRRLEIVFQVPVSGEVTAIVQLAPRRPLTSREALLLPAPRAAQRIEGLLACQLFGLEGHLNPRGLTAFDRQQFASLWKQAAMVDPRLPWLPAHAFSFQRGKAEAPALQLDLHVASPRARAVQSIAWHVGIEDAEFEANTSLTAPDGDLTLVEWDVPPEVTVARLTGAEVLSWSQTGTRVQAWLDSPRRGANLHLSGWRKKGRSVTAPPAHEGAVEFHLPCLQLLSASNVESRLRIAGTSGLTLEPLVCEGLAPLPDPRVMPADLAYYTPQSRYTASFRVKQATSLSDARVLTLAEIRGRQLVFTAVVDYQVRRGVSEAATVELHHWPGPDARCEALEGAAEVRRAKAGATPTCTVRLQPGADGRCRCRLMGTMPLEQASAGAIMPDLRLVGAARVERWVATSASDLQAGTVHGLEPTSDPGRALGVWADPLRRTARTAWRVTAEDWRLVLRPRTRPVESPGVQVLLAEQECAVADGLHWVYQSTYWIYHEANTDLNFLLPGRARVLSVAVDERTEAPLQPAPGRLWVPLPGLAGSRRLRVRWTLEEDKGLEQPRMQMPALNGVDEGPVLWTVHVPAGYQPAPVGNKVLPSVRTAAPASAAGLELRRAAGQHRLSAILAEKLRSGDSTVLASLVAAQGRFYRACRYADQTLAVLGDGNDLGPADQSLDDWLSQLREQNVQLAREKGFESLRADAERQVRSGPHPASPEADDTRGREAGSDAGQQHVGSDDFLPRRGSPMYWQGAAGAAGPHLVLTTLRDRDRRRALGASLLWLILLMGAALAARFRGLRNWLRLFWPEQVALLGCLVWQTFGPSLLLTFLLALAICGRLITVLPWLGRWWRPAPPQSTQPPA
jgi:hypothetical protein